MAFFPFMIQLDDKTCLVAGGGRVALRKVELLSSFGAYVKVVAPQICDEIRTISENNNNVQLFEKKIDEADIDGVDVVVMATDNSELNSKFAKLCNDKKILVNVVDVKKDCGFYFPAIIKQEDVVIGISTGGSSPLLASEIKKDINSKLRSDYGTIAKEMEEIRAQVLNEIDDEKKRLQKFKEELDKRLHYE